MPFCKFLSITFSSISEAVNRTIGEEETEHTRYTTTTYSMTIIFTYSNSSGKSNDDDDDDDDVVVQYGDEHL